MHETLSSQFKGYIDNFFVDNGNLRVSGWLTTTLPRHEVVYYVDVGHEVAIFNFNNRQDVADFYNTNDSNFVSCGFDICIPYNGRENYTILAKQGTNIFPLFDLNLNQNTSQLIESGLAAETFNVKIRDKLVPDFLVIDNFYENPDEVRQIALEQNFDPDLRYHKGKRTNKKFLAPNTKEIFESLIGRKITNWVNYEYNGVFQYCTPQDLLVIHSDVQSYAGMIYLTPDAPPQTGTSFYRSKAHPEVRKCHVSHPLYNEVFKEDYYDKTKFELVDIVGNVYNRLVLFDSSTIHTATEYFGNNKENSRLFHLFFFDIE